MGLHEKNLLCCLNPRSESATTDFLVQTPLLLQHSCQICEHYVKIQKIQSIIWYLRSK